MTEQLPLHGIAVYNPGILSKEELKRYFVARQPLLENLLVELKKEKPGKTPQHRLIVGTRGMGKTTLLHRLALAVVEDPVLSKSWLPLNFPEEQYNIARLSDLWVNCLDALGDSLEAAGETDLLDELDNCVVGLPSQEEERAKKALQNLMGFADRLGRRFLLLVDNIDIVLDRLNESHWEIREVLGHEPRLMLVGASAQVLEATFKYEAAFYDFFKTHELKGLNETEMRNVLKRLAEVDKDTDLIEMIEHDPARLRTLHTLTGGNPRTAVLLYGVLAQGINGDVRSDLERLLDHCTPLYKARFEELPSQAQKVVDAMAIHWDPLTAGQLSEFARLPVNSVSTQLTRLEQQGVVEKVALRPGRKNGFQIAERFFNIWYLMRTSRRVRRRLVWLVQFLKVFYSQDQLCERARRHLQNHVKARDEECLRHAEYAFSLARAVEDQTMRSALESSALQVMVGNRKLRDELSTLIEFDDGDGELKSRAERMQFMKELPGKVVNARKQWPAGLDSAAITLDLQGSLGLGLDKKQQVIERLSGLTDEQIMELHEIFQKERDTWQNVLYGNSELVAAIREAVAGGLMLSVDDVSGAKVAAEVLHNNLLGAFADVSLLEENDFSYSTEELYQLRLTIETFNLHFAWNNLGTALDRQGDLDGAISAYRKQIETKPEHESAWYNLGIALGKQGDLDGAIAAYRKQIEINPEHKWAWNNLGNDLGKQGDLDGAIAAYRKQIEIKPEHETAWNNLGNDLGKQGDLDGAIAAYRKQIEIKPEDEFAWNNLGTALDRQGDLDGAIAAYRKQIEIKPEDEFAWNNLGNDLGKQGDLDGAIAAYRKHIEINPEDEFAWNNLGNALGKQGDLDGAIAAYRHSMSLPSTIGIGHNSLAWFYYEQQQNLVEAEEIARGAVQLDPKNPDYRHTLAILFVVNGNWSDAEREARMFLELGEDSWLEVVWEYLVMFFHEAVNKGYTAQAVKLLDDMDMVDRLRPLYAALKAIAEGQDQLTKFAPEVRQPAQMLMKQLTQDTT